MVLDVFVRLYFLVAAVCVLGHARADVRAVPLREGETPDERPAV